MVESLYALMRLLGPNPDGVASGIMALALTPLMSARRMAMQAIVPGFVGSAQARTVGALCVAGAAAAGAATCGVATCGVAAFAVVVDIIPATTIAVAAVMRVSIRGLARISPPEGQPKRTDRRFPRQPFSRQAFTYLSV